MHTDGRLFATTARYCPRCLAGDGSDIQNAHGGPWQILWRLPVVFACPLHKVFLKHLCPHCHKPVNSSSRAQLFPRPAATGVRPAHCRSSTAQDIPTSRPGAPCGAPLTHDPLHHHRPAVDRHLAIHEGTDSRPYRSTGAPVDALACAGLLQVIHDAHPGRAH